MMDKSINIFLKDHRELTRSVLLILAAVSGYFTYLGAELQLDVAGADWQNRASAAVFAVGVTAAIYLFWSYALAVMPGMPTRKSRVAGMLITGTGCLFLVSLSSWLNVTALAGAGALEVHMKRSLNTYERALDAAYRRARHAEHIIPDLEASAGRYERLAKQERRSGVVSGVPGAGGVADALSGTAQQLRNLIAKIKESSQRAQELVGQAKKQLALMHTIALSDEPLTRRLKEFAGAANRLSAGLAELDNLQLDESLQRTMIALPDRIMRRATSIRSARIAKAQNEAITHIRKDLAKTAETLAKAVRDNRLQEHASSPHFEMMSVVEAVWHYSDAFIPYWAGGIALDLMPTVLILYLMLIVAVQGTNPDMSSKVADLRVSELLEAHRALDAIYRSERASQNTRPE